MHGAAMRQLVAGSSTVSWAQTPTVGSALRIAIEHRGLFLRDPGGFFVLMEERWPSGSAFLLFLTNPEIWTGKTGRNGRSRC